jgi:hypothetical protein
MGKLAILLENGIIVPQETAEKRRVCVNLCLMPITYTYSRVLFRDGISRAFLRCLVLVPTLGTFYLTFPQASQAVKLLEEGCRFGQHSWTPLSVDINESEGSCVNHFCLYKFNNLS